jgi:hypothetical protein
MPKQTVNGVALTPTEMKVYQALTTGPDWPELIACRAGLKNMHKGEAGAKYCIALTKKGLAKKHGRRSAPQWSRADE